MEQQVLDLLVATLDPSGPIRNDAERHLESLYANDAFPISLISIASHKSVPLQHRQAALLSLKKLVLKTWSPSIDEFEGPTTLDDTVKGQVRQSVLEIATGREEERKIVAAAAYVVSKIASADFPEQWPTLLPTILSLVPRAEPTQLYGVLIVLSNLVEDGFDEEQFSTSAAELVKCLYDVAVDEQKKLMTRALAVSIFRACFDTMELVYQTNPDAVQQFMQQASDVWTVLFLQVVRMPLPPMPSEQETDESRMQWQGVVALKTQVVKALDKIQNMFPQLLSTRTVELFSAIWEALQAHLMPYHALYTGQDTTQARLEDSDRLPFSLDFLVIEELDYMITLLGTAIIKHEFNSHLNREGGAQDTTWIMHILAIAVGFSHIPTEDAEMWELDVNCFLSEETSETANYTARNACAGLAQKLSGFNWPIPECLLAYSKTSFENTASSPKDREAALYILKQVIEEIESFDKGLSPEVGHANLDFVRMAVQDKEHDYLRARGYLVAGAIVASPYEGKGIETLIPDFAHQSLQAIESDKSDMVKVSCIRVMQRYLKVLPADKAHEFQILTVTALSSFISAQDMNDISDGEDLLDTLVETLRDAISTDPAFSVEHSALDVLFTMANYGASSWNTTMIVGEAFESIVEAMSAKGPEEYARLCAKVLPSLTGALDVGGMTEASSLSDMAVSLIATLCEHGSEPLPPGFVATLFPKLHRLLFIDSQECSVHQSATLAIKHMLTHDPAQLFAYHDPETGKGGLEVLLIIIDRLLGPGVDDSSASEVGGLAVELVQKAGAERLGPYLQQLLSVVAIRLSTAERANFIQNLVLVFVRLSMTNAKDVLDFLAQVNVGGESGLEVVLKKWLENSVNFSGYDAIRENVVALTNIYKLHDERLANIQTKGDLVVENTSRIKTRSQAKKAPDQFSSIPVTLKLTKVLVQELSPSPTKTSFSQRGSIANGRKQSIVSEEGEEEWEDDEPAVLDLAAPSTRQGLMGYMDETLWNTRQTGYDDETQKYLVQFFNEVATEPTFQQQFHALNNDERMKLQEMNAAYQQ